MARDSVSRLPDKDHVRFGLNNHGQTLAKDRMVFDTQDAYLFGLAHDSSPLLAECKSYMFP